MLKYLDFRHYSLAKKMSLLGFIFMLFMFILAILNMAQFKALGVTTAKLTDTEIPVLDTIHKLESLIMQQTILRHQILLKAKTPDAATIAVKTSQYDELSDEIEKSHHTLNELMKNYAKLQIASTKARWKRLQQEKQDAIQSSLDKISTAYQQHKQLTNNLYSSIENPQGDGFKQPESEINKLEETIHEELGMLSISAHDGITSSGKKIDNMQYGARQITLFLLFWFYLLGGVAGYFIIKLGKQTENE